MSQENNSQETFYTEDLDRDLEGKQEVLIDGKNIKKINGQSILGEGNLTIKEAYNLTEADKNDIADIVLSNFTDVSEVGQ